MIRLSICMIVKNEEENLKRCLDSLAEIRSQILSELIIVDTGSTDRTVEIAKGFTPHVYFREWNFNFAEMRNVSISYATGEWILIIDADEVIADPKGIIDVFSESHRLKTVNTLVLKVKDYTKASDETSYYEYIAPRVFRNDGQFHFEGSIHNQPMMQEPVLRIPETVLKHFGYDSDNEALIAAKVERTTTMLKKELDKNPDDIYYLFQLSTVYRMGGMYAEALKAIEKAFELVTRAGYKPENLYVVKQYVLSLKDLEENARVAALQDTLKTVIDQDMDLSFYFADTMMKTNDPVQAKKHYLRYLELLTEYRQGKETRLDLMDSVQSSNLDEEAFAALADIAFAQKRYDEACEYFKKLSQGQYDEKRAGCFVRSLIFSDQRQLFNQFVSNLRSWDRSHLNASVISAVEEVSLDLGLADVNVWTNGAKGLSIPYEILILAREATSKGGKLDPKEMLKFFADSFTGTEPFYADFLYFALLSGQSPLGSLGKYTNSEIGKLTGYLNRKYTDFKVYAMEMLESNHDFSTLRAKACIEMTLLTDSQIDEDVETAIGIDLILNKVEWLYGTYKSEVLEKKAMCMTGTDRTFAEINRCFLGKLEAQELNENLKNTLGAIGSILARIVESSWEEIRAALGTIRDNAARITERQPAVSIQDEFSELNRLMKKQIDQLEGSGDYPACIAIIDEYLKIVPGDLEMLARKSELVLKRLGLSN